jgi:hypothetical protein
MVTLLPLRLLNGLLHAPEHSRAGIVPPLEFQDARDHQRLFPVFTKAADAPGPLVQQESRTRPFHLESVLVKGAASILRVHKWQRGCFFSPAMLPEAPPWIPVIQAREGTL